MTGSPGPFPRKPGNFILLTFFLLPDPVIPKRSEKLQADFDAFCTELFRKEMESSSTLDLHYTLLHPENYGIDAEDAALGTYRLSELIKSNHEIHDLKEKLSEFDPHMLSDDQQILYDALFERIETGLMAEGLELYDQPLAPTIGIQAQLPILLAEYSFHSLQDVERLSHSAFPA